MLLDDGRDDPLHPVVEIKGYPGEDAGAKKEAMETHWVPRVNNPHFYGRWAFAEFAEVYENPSEFEDRVEAGFNRLTSKPRPPAEAAADWLAKVEDMIPNVEYVSRRQ